MDVTLDQRRTEYAANPTPLLEEQIAKLQDKINAQRARKNSSKSHKESTKRRKAAKAAEKWSGFSSTVTTPKISNLDAEMQDIELDEPTVETERPITTKDEVDMARAKATKAKAKADKAVQRLKSLRTKGNAGSVKITAARAKIVSKIEKATRLEIAAIFKDDDFPATVRQEATTVDEAHVSVEEGYASSMNLDDNDSLGAWDITDPHSNSPLFVPEIFAMPTPAPTISSPITLPASPVKEEASVGKGTKDDPIKADLLVKEQYNQDADHYTRVTALYKKALSAREPQAMLIEEYSRFLQAKEDKSVVHSIDVTIGFVAQLIENVWLDADIIGVYVELLAEQDSRFQVIPPVTIKWVLDGLKTQDLAITPFQLM